MKQIISQARNGKVDFDQKKIIDSITILNDIIQ